MSQHVCVAVTSQAITLPYSHTSQQQRPIRGKAMRVQSLPHLHLSLFQDHFLSSSNCLTHRTSFGVVTLMFSLEPSTTLTRPPALSTKEESSGAESRISSSCPYAETIDVPRKIWGDWAHPTRDLSSVSRITPSPSTNLTVSVLGTAITTPSLSLI